MAEAVVSFVVDRIGDLLIQEADYLANVSARVHQMQQKLRCLQSFLQDADGKQDQNESVRTLVFQIIELAYEAENVVETFVLEIASRRENGFWKKTKRYATIITELGNIHRLAKKIEDIQGRITSLTISLTSCAIQIKNEPQGTTTNQHKLRRTYSHFVEEHTIGLDKDVAILVTKLGGEEKNIGQIVSISGMGGLGKTTLAHKLYHHDKVRGHFDAFAWFCVSQQFQARHVWEGILNKLVVPTKKRRDEISKMNDDEIAKELYLLLQKKKCLVVLDDIWTEDAWDLLKPAFPLEKAVGGNKILLTTRTKTLALHADPRAFSYELQTLNEPNSLELFQRKAFIERENPDFKEMKELGMELVKKCEGLPLAIIVLGGLLKMKDFPREWEKVRDNVNLYLSEKKTDQEYSIVNGVLALSYNELSYFLKLCFLHLGNFPEDYNIPCATLFRMWAAEGLVSHCQYGETMEDVAERYLCELVNRSIVQVSQMGSVGRVKTCRLHDLMRNFCLSKAGKENYLESVHASNLNEKTSSNSVYRLVVQEADRNDLDLGCYARTPSLRSFLLFSSDTNDDYTIVKTRFNDFKFLKILSLERCRIEKKMGKEIGGLIHLRYLAIRSCEIKALPSSIENLRYLQSLIITSYRGTTTKIPNVLWKLEQLRHVILGGYCEVEGENGLKLGNMKNLQILHLGIGILLFDVGELVSSSHLKELKLDVEENLDEIPSACLGRLSHLKISSKNWEKHRTTSEKEMKRLLSSCRQLLELHLDRIIKDKLPECQHFPQNLIELTLVYCHLKEDPMPILEKLPNLRILSLCKFSFSGRLLVCSSKGFPKLQSLHLIDLRNLEEWRVDEEAMPNLSKLRIFHCQGLEMIPDGIKFITTLRQLQIHAMSEEFEDRVRVVDGTEGEDFYKVRHVPSIDIRYTEDF